MKRSIICLLLVIALIAGMSGAIAEIDYSGLTLDELLAEQEKLTAAIEIARAASEDQAPEEDQVPELDSSMYTELSKGAKGEDVKALQQRLKELGFYSSSVDGDYGNGTVNAIKAFEEFNGIEQTGIASPQLQAFLFSENAKGIEIPDVEITSIGLKKSYGAYFARPTFVNHTDYTIDGITYALKAYNAAGERILYQVLSISDVARYDGGDDFNLTYSVGEVNGMKIKSGGKYTVEYKNQIDMYSFDQDLINEVYMAVIRYHTTDGNIIEIAENDQIWMGSNGNIVTIQYPNNDQVISLTPEIEDEADSFKLGLDLSYISNFFAEVAGLPVGGCRVNWVDDYDGAARNSGIKDNDIIVKIGDIWVYDEDSILFAKGLMKQGEPTVVQYYRRGELRETEFIR